MTITKRNLKKYAAMYDAHYRGEDKEMEDRMKCLLKRRLLGSGCGLMVAMNQIEEFGRRIGEEFRAERVILFGSYVLGNANPDSDVDILVIGSFEGRSVDKSVEIRMKLRPGFSMDLLVRSPEKVRERIEMGDTFIREILDQGKVLYEADHR